MLDTIRLRTQETIVRGLAALSRLLDDIPSVEPAGGVEPDAPART